MPIIGTAGHVDHGKSTLVRALTGRDPDRWDEEKERGLTIDLGFAWTEIGGQSVGFVDVPGHERFIKNMLAGVGGLDVALFVVAADEGWMPQSEEHLAVLDLLDRTNGVIALTRIDLADDDIAELAELEITERIEGTALESWPIVRLAAPSGQGLDQLRSALAEALERAGAPRDLGRPRLWIDRAFVISGAGTVVTGTLVDGSLHRGDELALWPDETSVRIRQLQTHESEVESIGAGSRAAANLAGTDRSEVARGAMLGNPQHFRPAQTVVADLRPVRNLGESVTSRGAFQVHVGSGSWPAQVRLLETKNLEGSGAALIRLDQAVPLTQGDRLILRETGRRAVVAGGVVLDPGPTDLRTSALVDSLKVLRETAGADADTRADALLRSRGMATVADLSRDTGGGSPLHGLRADDMAVADDAVGRAVDRIAMVAGAFHQTNPLRPGISKAALASQADLPPPVIDAVLASSTALIDDGSTVRLATFSGGWGEAQDAAFTKAMGLLTANGLAVPRASALGLDAETLHAALRSDRLTKVGEDLVYLPRQLDEIIDRLRSLPGGFTVAEFRDALGVTRRHAIPLVEWLDRSGWTTRSGDTRSLRPQPSQSSDDAPLP